MGGAFRYVLVTRMRVKGGNKAGLITYLTNEEGFLRSRMRETSRPVLWGAHRDHKAKNTAGGAGIDKHIYYETNIYLFLVRLRGK
jgi:hypothetical protein